MWINIYLKAKGPLDGHHKIPVLKCKKIHCVNGWLKLANTNFVNCIFENVKRYQFMTSGKEYYDVCKHQTNIKIAFKTIRRKNLPK